MQVQNLNIQTSWTWSSTDPYPMSTKPPNWEMSSDVQLGTSCTLWTLIIMKLVNNQNSPICFLKAGFSSIIKHEHLIHKVVFLYLPSLSTDLLCFLYLGFVISLYASEFCLHCCSVLHLVVALGVKLKVPVLQVMWGLAKGSISHVTSNPMLM